MSNFYISDLHFGMQKAAERMGYTDVEKRDDDVIDRINQVCGAGDLLFILGDVASVATDPTPYLHKMRPKKILIVGNHDKKWIKHRHFCREFVDIRYEILERDCGTKIYLCHYPMAEYDGYFKGFWHFYGHIHDESGIGASVLMKYAARSVNVGVDVIGRPMTAEELMELRKMNVEQMLSGLSEGERKLFDAYNKIN